MRNAIPLLIIMFKLKINQNFIDYINSSKFDEISVFQSLTMHI